MKRLLLFLCGFIAISTHAETLQLSDIMALATVSPDSINSFLTNRGWKRYSSDTTKAADGESLGQYNARWGYIPVGDSMVRYWIYYKKKQNKVTKEKGYYENIQYSLECKTCFKELEDSVISMGWPRLQDDRSDKQKMQGYDQGDFSVLLITHYKGNEEYYDLIVFRKKPIK